MIYICTSCNHLLTRHLLSKDAHDMEGPYRCPCGCEVNRNDPAATVTTRQYEQGRDRWEPPSTAEEATP